MLNAFSVLDAQAIEDLQYTLPSAAKKKMQVLPFIQIASPIPVADIRHGPSGPRYCDSVSQTADGKRRA